MLTQTAAGGEVITSWASKLYLEEFLCSSCI